MEITQTKDIIYTDADYYRLRNKLNQVNRLRFRELVEIMGNSTAKANAWMRLNCAFTPEGSRALSQLIGADHASFVVLNSMVTEARSQMKKRQS